MDDFDYIGLEFAKLGGSTDVRIKISGDQGEARWLAFPPEALDKLADVIREARKTAGID